MSTIVRGWAGVSEGENQTCGWHGSMGELVHSQWAQPKIGDFVDEASVFSANCHMPCERQISARSVCERSSGLLAYGVDIAGIERYCTPTHSRRGPQIVLHET